MHNQQPVDSAYYFDQVARDYDAISEPRAAYLRSIENIIAADAVTYAPKSYIDIGCGRGDRTRRIAEKTRVDTVVGIDESEGMLREAIGIKTIAGSIGTIRIDEKFDMVTMLWNVLGHVNDADRVAALQGAARLMKPDARFYFDLNSRDNKKAYGETSADVISNHTFEDIEVATPSHRFNRREVETLISATDMLRLIDVIYVDYESGDITQDASAGQMLFITART